MSSLFRRLAHQVIGPAPARVHARAGLRYQPASFETADDAVTPRAGNAPPVSERPLSSLASPTPIPDQAAGPGAVESESDTFDMPQTPDPLAPITPEPGLPVPENALKNGLPPPPATTRSEQQATGSPAARRNESQARSGRQPSASAKLPTTRVATPSAPSLADVLPDPLLPPVDDREMPVRTRPSRTSPVEKSSGLSGPAASSEPNEVHVHIGRIEVTASTEPTAAKRPARRGTPPLSLDDYLARRERGRQ
jgi:hypothetical protein